MDLLVNMENSAEALRQNTVAPSNGQSTDFLRQFGFLDLSNSSDIASNKADFRYAVVSYMSMKFNLFLTLDTHG